MSCREEENTLASDELMVHWKQPSIYLMTKLKQDRDAPRYMQ
jgi:hypothetical protein